MRPASLVLALLSATLFTLPAFATPITENILIDATDGTNVLATGSYNLSFDPTMDYMDETSGFVVNSYTGNSTFIPAGFTYFSGADILLLGGLLNGVSGDFASTDDYVFQIVNFTTAPQLVFYVGTSSDGSTLVATDGDVTVNSVAPASTPEPSGLVLLGTGLLGMAGVARRRFARA